jgi:hypothetical protein
LVEKRGDAWFIKGSSEPFETAEEAMTTLRQRRRSALKDSGRRYTSEVFEMDFRCTWEVELAELLTELDIDFKFEPTRFYFRAERESYLPDFYLPEYNCWIEVKGFMDKRSQKRCKLFRKYHGHEYGYFIVMKEELELLRKSPEFVYALIGEAINEKERQQRRKAK